MGGERVEDELERNKNVHSSEEEDLIEFHDFYRERDEKRRETQYKQEQMNKKGILCPCPFWDG